MNTLYLRLPSAAALHLLQDDSALSCRCTLVTPDGNVLKDVMTTPDRFGELPETSRPIRHLVILPAAADMTVLHLTTPPLSGARLRQALPGLLEDHLLEDAEKVIVAQAARTEDGRLPVAAMRGTLLHALAARWQCPPGATLYILPLQAWLPEGTFTVDEYAHAHGFHIELAGRFAAQEPLGLTLHAEMHEDAAQLVCDTFAALQKDDAQLTLLVPPDRVAMYEAVARPGLAIRPDDGALYAQGRPSATVPDLATCLPAQRKRELGAWKRPLRLAAAVLLINLVALHLDGWRLRHEANALRDGMRTLYMERFPKEQVILDPLLQMQRKVTATRQAAPDDFLALTADLAASLDGAQATAPKRLAYRNRQLQLSFADPLVLRNEARLAALASHGLSAREVGGNWQIGRQP